MAFHSGSFPFVLLFTLLSLFNFSFAITNHHSLSHNQINTICQQTQNPDFCETSLEGYLGDEKCDMNRLGIVSILLATAQARLNKYVVEQLMQTEVDLEPATMVVLEKCRMDYDVTLDKLQSAYHLSDQKDYKGMFEFVNDATMMTDECAIQCVHLQNPISSLKEDNQKMVWLNQIALVILGILKK